MTWTVKRVSNHPGVTGRKPVAWGAGGRDMFHLEHSELGAYRTPESAAHREIRGRAARADLEVTGDCSLGLSVASSPEKCAKSKGSEIKLSTDASTRPSRVQVGAAREHQEIAVPGTPGGGGRRESQMPRGRLARGVLTGSQVAL